MSLNEDKHRTLYGTLEIDAGATTEEIKTAFFRAASINHPDRGGDHEVMARINLAYMVLSVPTAKDKYDKELLLFGEICGKCNGGGRRYRTGKSFKDRTAIMCTNCNGHGILRWLRKPREANVINLSAAIKRKKK